MEIGSYVVLSPSNPVGILRVQVVSCDIIA
jgi:hypothetical protein